MEKKIASIIVVTGRELSREYRLNRSKNIIGRDTSASIEISGDQRISRNHASIKSEFNPDLQKFDYMIVDLNSTNHTYVNGEQISVEKLRDGDKIRVGDTILKFVLQDEIDAKFQKEIQRRLNYDNLTGLLTRESFEMAMKAELERYRKHKVSIAQFMMDIDHFKQVNDAFGHMAGSYVLSQVGILIRENLRSIDFSGRYGGEEFIAFMSDIKKETAMKTAERLRTVIKKYDFDYNECKMKITISIGVAFFPLHGETVEDLIHAADVALYQAKRAGRDQVVMFEPGFKISPEN
ncbi:diguanylate cyclase [candidate division CSSED10-310 bacterium]|uniref:Diguanylate cyclase n=1 Tax=candidate division CSSED10-310 bacterium TaxID=2855610 RepID=A0ABV6YSB1_UNCC1